MKKSLLYIFCLVAVLITSCEYDYTVDIPVEKKLVVLSNFSPNQAMRLYLSTNDFLADSTDRILFPENAQIKLYINNTYFEDLIYTRPSASTAYYSSSRIPSKGRTYRVEAYFEDFDSITAENKVPQPMEIDELVFTNLRTEIIPSFPDLERKIVSTEITIEDEFLAEKYFHLIPSKADIGAGPDFVNYGPEYVDIEAPVIPHEYLSHEDGEFFQGGIILKGSDIIKYDNTFQVDVSFDYFKEDEKDTPIYFELRTVSEDYYKFHKSLAAQNARGFNQQLISIQAIKIHNNIKNGIGNFSSYSSFIDSVKWSE